MPKGLFFLINYPAASSGVLNRRLFPIRRKRLGTNPEEIRKLNRRDLPMGDLIFIGLALAFFAVSYWFIEACERLRR